jgi:hypothetical protein
MAERLGLGQESPGGRRTLLVTLPPLREVRA